jgi:hypothetical protein
MDHRWGILVNEDQMDQPATPQILVPFGEMNEIGMPSLRDQAGCTFSILESAELNMDDMSDTVHNSSGFFQ